MRAEGPSPPVPAGPAPPPPPRSALAGPATEPRDYSGTECSWGRGHRGRSCQDAAMATWGLGIGARRCHPGLPMNGLFFFFCRSVSPWGKL